MLLSLDFSSNIAEALTIMIEINFFVSSWNSTLTDVKHLKISMSWFVIFYMGIDNISS